MGTNVKMDGAKMYVNGVEIPGVRNLTLSNTPGLSSCDFVQTVGDNTAVPYKFSNSSTFEFEYEVTCDYGRKLTIDPKYIGGYYWYDKHTDTDYIMEVCKVRKSLLKFVVFNVEEQMTILQLSNRGKIIVRCAEGDRFDPMIGFAMAVMRVVFGHRNKYLAFIEENEYDDEFEYALGYLTYRIFDGKTDLESWMAENARYHYPTRDAEDQIKE